MNKSCSAINQVNKFTADTLTHSVFIYTHQTPKNRPQFQVIGHKIRIQKNIFTNWNPEKVKYERGAGLAESV
jgi:hypothetical protein